MRVTLCLVSLFLCHGVFASGVPDSKIQVKAGAASSAVTAKDNAPASLFQEEETPLNLNASGSSHVAEPHFQAGQLLLVFLLLLVAGGCTVFFFRFLKTKGKWQGSRKYLIEQLGYCPMGTKTGVSLIKVGKEFLLIGITPQQVTMLSKLPKLEAQYEEESQFERETFRDAVGQEIHRMENETTI